MKINIYYGGRGLVDDPTIVVLDKMQAVLEELHVSVERFNLYEMKNALTTLPLTLKAADGIILATTVEWFGIGGYMQSFLDAIWMYGDKDKIRQIYMCPVVMSTTYGEREAKLNLSNAWEILGGLPASGICGYIKDVYEFEQNKEYVTIIEKKAEDLYRTIHQKIKSLPASNQAVNQSVALNKGMELTPQESEQLSKYASDEIYVQKQKEDIQELSALFKGMLGKQEKAQMQQIYAPFKTHFHPLPGQKGLYKIELTDREDVFYLKTEQHELEILEETEAKPDIEMTMTEEVLQKIVQGQETFQKAFMTGNIKMKGDFGLFRMLDEMFVFR